MIKWKIFYLQSYLTWLNFSCNSVLSWLADVFNNESIGCVVAAKLNLDLAWTCHVVVWEYESGFTGVLMIGIVVIVDIRKSDGEE